MLFYKSLQTQLMKDSQSNRTKSPQKSQFLSGKPQLSITAVLWVVSSLWSLLLTVSRAVSMHILFVPRHNIPLWTCAPLNTTISYVSFQFAFPVKPLPLGRTRHVFLSFTYLYTSSSYLHFVFIRRFSPHHNLQLLYFIGKTHHIHIPLD